MLLKGVVSLFCVLFVVGDWVGVFARTYSWCCCGCGIRSEFGTLWGSLVEFRLLLMLRASCVRGIVCCGCFMSCWLTK